MKFFLPLTEPLGFTWTLMLVGLSWSLWRKQWRSTVILGVPTLLLFVLGSTPLAAFLIAREEAKYLGSSVSHFSTATSSSQHPGIAVGTELTTGPTFRRGEPPFSSILVLGGGFYRSEHDAYGLRFAHGASRTLAGIWLAKNGAATNLVLGGGAVVAGVEEPAALQAWVESLSLPGVVITNLGVCHNTHDEALAFKRLQSSHQWSSVLLVTSAVHMTRSLAAFRKQSINVLPVACDFRLLGSQGFSISFFPSQDNLNLWSIYLHEKVGFLVYKCRGWV